MRFSKRSASRSASVITLEVLCRPPLWISSSLCINSAKFSMISFITSRDKGELVVCLVRRILFIAITDQAARGDVDSLSAARRSGSTVTFRDQSPNLKVGGQECPPYTVFRVVFSDLTGVVHLPGLSWRAVSWHGAQRQGGVRRSPGAPPGRGFRHSQDQTSRSQ